MTMATKLPSTRPLAVASLETGRPAESLAQNLAHWRCHRDPGGVEWWLLDQRAAAVNTLSEAVLGELDALVSRVRDHDHAASAVVIRSAKSNGFIAGAELREFRDATDARAVEARLADAGTVLEDLENLEIPTIALVHGFCLGAGLELALSCRYRIARNDSVLGFPEVSLGLHPGLGGSMRLCRQISPPDALKMMLTGKPVDARRAKKLGLVDALGEERHFANAVRQAAAGELPRRGRTRMTWVQNRLPPRRLIARMSERRTRARVGRQQYPAPFALIDLWRTHGGNSKNMLAAERNSFARLLSGPTAQNLVRVFFLRKMLKAEVEGDPAVGRVHVVGAGTMGGDIAAWCALKGLRVTLEDRGAEYLAPAIARARKLFDRELGGGIEGRDALDRLIPDLSGKGRGVADLVIEAVPEDAALKSRLLPDLEKGLKDRAILATNTSSIRLERLRDSLRDPSRFLGIHFFNPVARMQLVEIVVHDRLDEDIRQRAQGFTTEIDRVPVVVKSAPGFLINRVLTPYLLEALTLLDEGMAKEKIDRAAQRFGMPMGPVELADHIGLDICVDVADSLRRELEQPLAPIPDWLRQMVADGHLGKKSGQGLYRYDGKGKAKKSRFDGPVDPELQDRLLLPLINTCARCRGEGIVRGDDEVDAALIFATGFAPFRGGPLHYAKTRGIDEIVSALGRLSRQHGSRFEPAEGWRSMIAGQAADRGGRHAAA